MSSRKRTALVTGAVAGLGARFADLLARQGYDLVLVDRQAERLAERAKEIAARNHVQVHAVPMDLALPDAGARIFARCQELGVTVDVLVNNAGYHLNKLFHELPWDAIEANVRVLLDVVVELSHRFLPGMVERGWGRIVNVASMSGFMPGGVRLATYNATKAFLIPFTEALNLELEGTGVHASAVCPGFMRTELFEANGLTDVSDSVPSFMWLDPAHVASEALAAADRGAPVRVSGLPNQIIATAARFVPRQLLRERSKIFHRKAHAAIKAEGRAGEGARVNGLAALVTGASAGIGASFAEVLARRGYDVILVARREDKLKEIANEVARRHGVRTHTIVKDMTDRRAPLALHEACAKLGWPVDVVVNNAGYPVNELFHRMTWEAVDGALQILIRSVMHLTHLFLPSMVERRSGRIVNVASLAGFEPGSYRSSLYSSAKASVIGFTESIDAELEGTGVRATAVCPGFTKTEWMSKTGLDASKVPALLQMESGDVARVGYEAALRGTPVALVGTPAQRVLTAMFGMAPRRAVGRFLSSRRKQMFA
jgi:short-subunit dehydrogenase